jgi:hypothetical protein
VNGLNVITAEPFFGAPMMNSIPLRIPKAIGRS